MFYIIAQWILLFIIVCIKQLDSQIHEDKPKIITSNGDLILEPALDKNIYLRPIGDQSSVFIGNVKLSKLNALREPEHQSGISDNFNQYFEGPNGILQRLQALETKAPAAPDSILFNITLLRRRVNTLNRKLIALQIQLNTRPRDECGSRPCQHGGTCLNLVDGYHCLCPSNWEGKICDEDVDECRNFAATDLGCQNGARCINKPGTYECLCKLNWYGLHCTVKAKDCSAGDFEMCGHGTCISVSSGEGIKCICHQGWTTNTSSLVCLTDVDECDTHHGAHCSINPKVECVNLPGSFRCGQCPPGYEGDGYICNDIDECITTRNGGCSPLVACYNTIGSRICGACPPGYLGDGVTCTYRGSCRISHGGCHPSARCAELPSPTGMTVQCVCPEGMDGNGLGIAGCYVSTGNYTTGCENYPCGNHGRCHLLRSGYTCVCEKGYGGAHCDSTFDRCAVNPCQNGGVCRHTISGFRCVCTTQFLGTLCQVRSNTCGGILGAAEGSIAFPISNTTTITSRVQCAWLIQTATDKVLNVTFSQFALEYAPDCSADFLQMHDGRRSSSQLIGRFCGHTLPKGGNIITSQNNLYLWFNPNAAITKSRFTLHWTSVDPICGGEINATIHGHISSPGSPGPYPPNRDCFWLLVAIPGKRISIHFFAFDIEAHNDCSFDYLAIYDGGLVRDPLLSMYCTSTQPAPLTSASSHLLIHFHSDAYGSGNGFQLAYAPVEGIPGCGGVFTAYKAEIFSPSYNGLYTNHLLCEYNIKGIENTRIKITFKLFKLVHSIRCRGDYLKIYDGPSSESPLVGKFCGNVYPTTYTSSSNTLYMKFKTDGSTVDEGFQITYETNCDRHILGDSGAISSPSYPGTYPNYMLCEYVIEAVPGKAIQLTFQDFDIEVGFYNTCIRDRVKIRDGPDADSTLLGTYCGGPQNMPPTLTSTHNYMYVSFETDVDISGTGFYANYTTIDIACGGIYRHTVDLINHPKKDIDAYDDEQTCHWLLIAPEGMHIKLTWNRFYIEDTRDCVNDYLELVEINDDDKKVSLGRYCGTRSPPALTTSTNRLNITFVSDRGEANATYSGFSLSYNFLNETSCGGDLITTRGYIRSPGWPQLYKIALDCTWTITVPVGQQIALNITDSRIGYDTGNNYIYYDYLEIKNGGSINSPLIGRYKGTIKSLRITSVGNIIRLKLQTSSIYVRGSKFNIEWDGTITGCGGTLTSSKGTITSPNYPNNYQENAECFYRIVVNAGNRIHLSFTELDLGITAECRDDYIEIYNGRDTNAPSLGKHCKLNESAGMETLTNYAFVKLRVDAIGVGKGFVLDYFTVCNNNLTGGYGVIESPDFPNFYAENLKCSWNIQAPKGHKINITFTHFDVEEYLEPQRIGYHPMHRYHIYDWDYDWDSGSDYRGTCLYDYLQMQEKSEQTFAEKHCGRTLPSPISTKSNAFKIQFYTKLSSSTNTGFRLEWVSYGCGGHILKQSGTIQLDRSETAAKELECLWLIESALHKSINITFTEIYMQESKNCTSDAIEIYNGQNTNAPLLSKFCHRQKVTIESDSNYMLVRFVKRSTLKDVHFKSQFRSTKSKCGGVFNSMSGLFYSKNYPKNYYNNQDCIWYITVPENHRIEITILDFDLYSDPDDTNDDCGDSILIYDDNNYSSLSKYTYRICPDSNVTQIVTKYHHVVIQFKSDSVGTAKGFKANFSVTCGAVISAKQDGIITNNKHINHLNKSCVWTIITPALDQKISLTLTHMSLPKDTNVVTNRHCPSSFIRVLDGNDNKAPPIGEYCGRKVPPMIVSHGNAITIELGSYTDRMLGQFTLHYSSVLNTCGGTLHAAEEGTIASPLYPHPYPIDTNCEWVLVTSPGNTVYVTFEQFDLEYSDACNEDYLELRENDGGGKLLGAYCGSDIPTNYTSAAKMYIKFRSSNDISGQGFLLHYGYVHENDIQGEYGEISSPLYPTHYEDAGEYHWRIFTSVRDTITLIIDHLEISSQGDVSSNKLTIYDGYDSTAMIAEQELYGVIGESKTIQTSANVAYISLTTDESNIGSVFHLTWTQTSKNRIAPDSKARINCGSNQTKLVLPGEKIPVMSPNYPEQYRNDLNCDWEYSAQMGRHLSINFNDIDLEKTPDCLEDFVSVYSADSIGNWRFIKKICESSSVGTEFNSSAHMKINFRTQSSSTKKGFLANVRSKCGGLVTDLSGEIGITWNDVDPNSTLVETKCNWTIKVRPGRTIKLRFIHFNITNDDHCETFVFLRNGDSVEAPPLASGKYCGYQHEKKVDIVTSSNALYVSFTGENRALQPSFQNFKIFYEEVNYECGSTSTLTSDHQWETINSPNYPLLPIVYSECIWVFTGPLGEVLRIDFIDTFDIDRIDDCRTEVVEIRDGSSSLSPSKGRYCGQKPGTIKTSSNTVYIKYSTQLANPRHGFKANISIDVCGGTIIAEAGEVRSPGYPHMPVFPPGTVCQWHIRAPRKHVYSIEPKDVDLPLSEPHCATKIDIEETIPINTADRLMKTMCANTTEENRTPIVTSSNNVIIKLTYGKPAKLDQNSEHRGFRISFSSTRSYCGTFLTSSEGYLTTPSYPLETKHETCEWIIEVPDESRRIRLELIDYNQEKQDIRIFHDVISFIIYTDGVPVNESRIYESVSNTLVMFLSKRISAKSHRFKAKYTSYEAALCGGNLDSTSQELVSPDLHRPYTCKWHYTSKITTDDLAYNSIFITANLNSSVNNVQCNYYDPKITIQLQVKDSPIHFFREACAKPEESFRVPSSTFDIEAKRHVDQMLYFHLKFKPQPCGGTVHLGTSPVNIINTPGFYNDTLDCAWVLIVDDHYRAEITTEGSFLLGCDDEYVSITSDLTKYGTVVGNYCREKPMEHRLQVQYAYLYVEYHSNIKTTTSLRLIAKKLANQCGGLLQRYDRTFMSPNYPKGYPSNVECAWEIQADLGYRVSLQFVERFVVEDTSNCTKDAVIIYDWKEGVYEEMASVCGRETPPSYNSTHDRLKVVLRTDAQTNLDGFKAEWVPICGGNFVATDEEQILFSPGYPFGHKQKMSCFYEISSPNNEKISMKFIEFQLEGVRPACASENLTASYNKYEYKVLCGSEKPANFRSFDEIVLEFNTVKKNYVRTIGFKLTYSLYRCGGKVNDTTVTTLSFTEADYIGHLNCTWLIEASSNKIVVVKFSHIDVEGSVECDLDYLAMYDGLTINADKRLAVLCGNIQSTTIVKSTGNSMVLQFFTDASRNYNGFKATISFSYYRQIHLDANTSQVLMSPLTSIAVYEHFLDYYWSITSPPNTVIKITFSKFDVTPCRNQSTIGSSKCDCDLVQIKDGLNLDSLVMGIYCGYVLPPQLITSTNVMGVRMSTDGELASSGFEAILSVQQTLCGHSVIHVGSTPYRFKSPGYDTGSIPRGLHCAYHLNTSRDYYKEFRISVINLKLRPSENDTAGTRRCLKDKLIISNTPSSATSTNKDVIRNHRSDFYYLLYINERIVRLPNHFELCGCMEAVDFYMSGSISMNLITSPDIDIEAYRGVEIEVAYVGPCGRNYTEAQGRINTLQNRDELKTIHDCYTLITAPHNYTISLYFLENTYEYNYEEYVEIFDGDNPSSTQLRKIMYGDFTKYPVFSTGRHMLIHNHHAGWGIKYDANYVTTNKGVGCGGKMSNTVGAVTSPLYPNTYRRNSICEWILETPTDTRLLLHFTVFDLGADCEQNYLQFVDSEGVVVRTFCSEGPADYRSDDNYVKLVYYTSMNNSGRGWFAQFTLTRP